MLSRAVFILVSAFWVIMNILLWRAEYGRHNLLGGEVPARVVWQKMLTAQDASTLAITHHGRRIGFCRWGTSVAEEHATGGTTTEEAAPEGMVKKPTGYRIDSGGIVEVGDSYNHLRFDLRADFSANQEWKEFHLQLNLRPTAWEFRATAADQVLRIRIDDGATQTQRALKFSELSSPEALLQKFADPFSAAVLNAGALLSGPQSLHSLAGGVTCEARNGWIKIGRASVRAYQLEVHLIERYRAAVFVSRAGEILRVELPDELALVNEQLTNL
jgi:hypothetical protein